MHTVGAPLSCTQLNYRHRFLVVREDGANEVIAQANDIN